MPEKPDSRCESSRPIGIFDSGIGGLSVLRHIRNLLPNEHLVYIADSAFAPYGDKPESVIVERSLAIADFLIRQHAKAIVVACNTATAAAITALRERYPALILVGVEPGLKPAVALSRSRTVGVLATRNTLASVKFTLLRAQIEKATGTHFLLQPCIGLADQVEKGDLQSSATAALVQRYVAPLIRQGADTLVLGCTHYPFVQPLIEAAARAEARWPVAIVDTGEAVARQLDRLLRRDNLQRGERTPGTVTAGTTGNESALRTAFSQLLDLSPTMLKITAMPGNEAPDQSPSN